MDALLFCPSRQLRGFRELFVLSVSQLPPDFFLPDQIKQGRPETVDILKFM